MVIRMDQINKQTVSLSLLHPQSTAADASATESELAAINLKRKNLLTLLIGLFISGVSKPLPRETRNIREVST